MYYRKIGVIAVAAVAFFHVCATGNILAQENRPAKFVWTARAKRFEAIKQAANGEFTPAQKAELIALLKQDNEMIRDFNLKNWGRKSIDDEYGEAYGSYYYALLDTVAKFVDIRDALETLVRSAYAPESKLAKRLAEQKENLSPSIDELTKSPLGTDRERAAGILTFIAKDPSANCDTRKKVSDQLLLLAHDTDGGVKHQVIKSLAQIRTKKAIAALKDLAEHDPSSEGENGKLRYPAREQARAKLDEIDNAGGVKVDPCDASGPASK
jgi:hypothetical protein